MLIRDVSNWLADDSRVVSGTRTKYWLINPTNDQNALFKEPRANTGEAWAELVAALIGDLIHFPTATTSLATYHNTVGSLSNNFISTGEEFLEGGDLITRLDTSFDRYKLDHYTLDTILKSLPQNQGLEKAFLQIPVFDALIGNQDRHCDNWGVIRKGEQYDMAPLYDNGASLGHLLSEVQIKRLLNNPEGLNQFTQRSFSLIGLPNHKKPKHKMLLNYIYAKYPDHLTETIECLRDISHNGITQIIDEIPDESMSSLQKEWVIRFILHRKDWLLHWQREVKR